MQPLTNIHKMIMGNKILVPNYQRAYSWDISKKKEEKKQVETFLIDLEEYSRSSRNTSYYFGHFLFKSLENDKYHIIDGQQRLTTIIIFLSALFKRLKEIRQLNESELELIEDILIRRDKAHFSTVAYDDFFFKSYIIKQSELYRESLTTASSKRLADAFDYFNKCLEYKDELYITNMIEVVTNAKCTTHEVSNEAEAIQMFIFQNNRGKKPSNLEIIKAMFMYHIHLYSTKDEVEIILEDMQERFTNIYTKISNIENYVDEDDVLNYTMRVHFNSIWEDGSLKRFNEILGKGCSVDFIKSFTESLSMSFEYLSAFFHQDQKNNLKFHSLITLGGIGIALPFVIKAYKFNISIQDKEKLFEALESIMLRDKLIGTRADIRSRISYVYENFTVEKPSIDLIIEQIDYLKNVKRKEDWWSSYWNDENLDEALNGNIHRSIAKFLLWKYEVELSKLGKSGYKISRFDDIEFPHLEHIAPITEPNTKPHGYNEYSEEFINQYLNCIGNYLLISQSHNCSISNSIFEDKLADYKYLNQQVEIRDFIDNGKLWDIEAINKRKNKIINMLKNKI